jgi:pimeloyl-ACP methyl ester carboxylesterase
LIDHLGLDNVILYRHSAGGPIAIETTMLRLPLVSALVVSEGNLDAGGGQTSRLIAGFSPTANDPALTENFDRYVAELRRTGERRYAASLAATTPPAALGLSRSLIDGAQPSWREVLYNLPCQKTFIFGEWSLPDADVNELPRHGVHVIVVPGTGHAMAWENPSALANAIATTLA